MQMTHHKWEMPNKIRFYITNTILRCVFNALLDVSWNILHFQNINKLEDKKNTTAVVPNNELSYTEAPSWR